MKLRELRVQVQQPLPVVTLVLLVQGEQVWLAMKKRGFGKGWWNGFGGKCNTGETVEAAAIRETNEECGAVIQPTNLKPVAAIDFYFMRHLEKSQRVQAYICESWEGEPHETEEMAPRLFPNTDLPLNAMWPADRLWVPLVLAGKTGTAEVLFGDLASDDPILEYHINLV